jgi:branched-chain amino acid aminotransferase
MNNYIILNGRFKEEKEPLVPANSRAFRYGDGLFETMKSVNGKISLEAFHFERLFSGMKELAFEFPSWCTPSFLREQIVTLLEKNKHLAKARVRLMVFRGNGGLFESDYQTPNYLIESLPLIAEDVLNEKGLTIDIFPKAFKSRDVYASLKTNNFLPYTMAAIYATQQHLNDCLVLNTSRRICDATIANLFIIKNKVVYTPAISEGCIAGVMRRYLITALPGIGYEVNETSVTPDQLTDADEIFLTNAIYGIRWVKICGNLQYTCEQTIQIYNKLIKPLFQ